MNLLNEYVTHKNEAIGRGQIIQYDEHYILVDFSGKTMKFAYPMAFIDKYLKAENPDVMVKAQLDYKKLEEEQQKKIAIIEAKKKKLQEDLLIYKKIAEAKKQAALNKGMNYAFKCNYCDGGANNDQIGFAHVCSNKMIAYNIDVEKKSWCSHPDCLCKRYHNGRLQRVELDNAWEYGFVCYEAYMLTKWEVFAGVNHKKGDKQGKARTIPNLCPGKLCVLTTRDPLSTNEAERYIFAAFITGAGDEGDENNSGFIRANLEYTIKFNYEEAHKLLFWDYHKNANAPDKKVWGMGLYRKFGDEEAMQFLDAIVDVKKGTKDEQQALKIRNYYIDRNIRNRF